MDHQVVERASATLDMVNEQCIPMAANHREMVHFKDVKSQKFEPVKGALQELKDGKPIDPMEWKIGTFFLCAL